ncbi:hypothetical protein DKX38_015888 [Salix brachista]|uniref:Uncharacterized protein n=1 Tax=Salix brachista TaxID=2182728 RepID=A0A5N5L6H7_9ROSI|nr:hypothetical protein DKX38_015888 [Salix brachista]
MSSKKEEKSQAAAERIKAAAMSAAKGLSRAQAERAAAAAARNVNAYGQKEEGPSRWQEKREAKRQMYLMSTEKAVRLGERKDLNSMSKGFVGNAQCQKCFQSGHWTYECKNERVYMSRPSRTQQLKNPKLRPKVSISYDLENPEGEDNQGQKREKKSKRKHRSDSDSGSTSEASVFETDSESSSVTGSESSEEERGRRGIAGGDEATQSSRNEQRVLSGVFGSRNMRFTQILTLRFSSGGAACLCPGNFGQGIGPQFCREIITDKVEISNNFLYPKEDKKQMVILYAFRSCDHQVPPSSPLRVVEMIAIGKHGFLQWLIRVFHIVHISPNFLFPWPVDTAVQEGEE